MLTVDPRVAIWNNLHDGEITVMGRSASELAIFVNIPYVRKRFKPAGDSFLLRLRGFRAIEYVDYEGNNRTSDPDEIENRGIEILSTQSSGVPVKISTTQGYLNLDFDVLEIFLDTGQQVEFEAVGLACREYWDEWEAQAGQNQEPRAQSTDPAPASVTPVSGQPPRLP
jgi:hypothetical protein